MGCVKPNTCTHVRETAERKLYCFVTADLLGGTRSIPNDCHGGKYPQSREAQAGDGGYHFAILL